MNLISASREVHLLITGCVGRREVGGGAEASTVEYLLQARSHTETHT